MARDGAWLKGWPLTCDRTVHGITDAEVEAVRRGDERTRAEATNKRIPYSGGVYTVGVDSLGSLADHIVELVSRNKTLLQTSTRLARGTPPRLRESGTRAPTDPLRGPDKTRSLAAPHTGGAGLNWLLRRGDCFRLAEAAFRNAARRRWNLLEVRTASTCLPGRATVTAGLRLRDPERRDALVFRSQSNYRY